MNTNNNNNSNTPPTPTDVSGWSIDQVASWASSKFSAQTVQKLRDQEVSGNSLLTLTYAELTSAPFNLPGGAAKEIVNFAIQLQSAPPQLSTVPSDSSSTPGTVNQDAVATMTFNRFIDGVADRSVQYLLRTLFSQVQLVEAKPFEDYSNHFVRGIPSRSGSFNMLHSTIKHPSKEATAAIALADRQEDPDDIPVVVLLGVSGAGKTKTAYEISKERYTVYFEATTIHSGDLTAAIKQMKHMELSIPLAADISQIAASRDTFEMSCLHIIHRLILARVLTLLLLYGSGKVTSPLNWLLSQLNGGGAMSEQIFNKLMHLTEVDQLQTMLHSALLTCKTLFGLNLTVITDEAHLLLHELPGAFRRPSYKTRSSALLYSPNKGIRPSQSRPFLSYWLTSLCTLPLLPIVCGTALRLRDLEVIRSAAGRTEKLPIVIKDLPYLNQSQVEAILRFHFDLTGIPEAEIKRIASELMGRPRTLYEFIKRVAIASTTRELNTPDKRFALLNEELQTFRTLMTTSCSASISYRSFFEELVVPVQDVIPITYDSEGEGLTTVIDEVASMLFQTLSKQKVEFEFSADRDFVNAGICMLCDVKNDIGVCSIMEPWVVQAAMNFFSDHKTEVALKAIDYHLFSGIVSPQGFGMLFDYRVAFTILSRWQGRQVLSIPVFANIKDVEWLHGVTFSASGLRDDRISPVSTYGHFVESNFPVRGHKRSLDDNKIDQRDPAYYNCVYMATDKNRNDVIVTLAKGTEVVSVLIIGNKISLVEQTTGKQKFETAVSNAQEAGVALDNILDIAVRNADHDKNVEQTKPLYGLQDRVQGGYIVAYVEFPKTKSMKPGCVVSNSKVVLQVDSSNLADFLLDEKFVQRLNKQFVKVLELTYCL